jgi:uncharacterized MAPEG superfamily protein
MFKLLLHEPVMKSYAIAACAAVLNLVLLSALTALRRLTGKVMINPEDTVVLPGAKMGNENAEVVQRVRRAHQNAVESMVPFFGIGLLYALSQPGRDAAAIVFAVFIVARWGHSLAYIGHWQPWRTVGWAIANLALLWMAGTVLLAAL